MGSASAREVIHVQMNNFSLSSAFNNRVKNTFGEQGKAWLNKLPSLISTCEKQYRLKVVKQYQYQSVNFVAEAKKIGGGEVVVKFCPSFDEIISEISALNYMAGNGMVKLFAADEKQGFMILEKLNPNVMLSDLTDDIAATNFAADIMLKIWRPIKHNHIWKTTQQCFKYLDKKLTLPSGFAPVLVDKAKLMAQELHQDMGEVVLLHEDLHHFNILSATRQPWLAIDPKGIVGEREYEVGALLRNPIPFIVSSLPTKKLIDQRIQILAEKLGFDKQRIKQWGFTQAVLAAIWSIDSKSSDWKLFLSCAKALSKIV